QSEYGKKSSDYKNSYMDFSFNLFSFFLGVLAGAVAGCFLAYYFLKKYMEKKMQEVAKLMKKEEIRQLASAFGHNLSEQQINLMMTSMERAMEQAKAKSKKSK
ncbi:19031_t:CDS:1, partial [Entrophospora sp. SA101]